jgi:hypothetical protein
MKNIILFLRIAIISSLFVFITSCESYLPKHDDRVIPDGYEENYIKAYRRCQDRPGGEMILR